MAQYTYLELPSAPDSPLRRNKLRHQLALEGWGPFSVGFRPFFACRAAQRIEQEPSKSMSSDVWDLGRSASAPDRSLPTVLSNQFESKISENMSMLEVSPRCWTRQETPRSRPCTEHWRGSPGGGYAGVVEHLMVPNNTWCSPSPAAMYNRLLLGVLLCGSSCELSRANRPTECGNTSACRCADKTRASPHPKRSLVAHHQTQLRRR